MRLFIIGVESIRCGRKSTDLTKCSGGCPSFFSPGLMASVFVDRETRPLVILLQTHPWLYECTSYRGEGGRQSQACIPLHWSVSILSAPRRVSEPIDRWSFLWDRHLVVIILSGIENLCARNCWRYISLVLQAYVFTYEYMYVCMRVCVYVIRPNLCVCMCIWMGVSLCISIHIG